jgi:hypothetical protein
MIEIILDGTWQDLHALTGIPKTSTIDLFNKSSSPLLLEDDLTVPTSVRLGLAVSPRESIIIEATTATVWVKGTGPIIAIADNIFRLGSTFPQDMFTSNTKGIRRLQVDPGEAAYFEGRMYRISYEYDVGTTPLVIRFSCPRGFTLHFQDIVCDQGGLAFRAWRSAQGTPGGTFSTAITQWPVKGNAETPVFTNPVTIFSGGTFTPTGGQTAAETLRVLSNVSSSGPSSNRGSVGSTAQGERGLPAGDYYLVMSRLPGVTVNALGVIDLIYAADRV